MKMPKSSFVEIMGDNPYNRILDFLITERGLFDYSITEMAGQTGVAWVTVQGILRHLLRENAIKRTRTVGKAEMFMLNEDSPVAQVLVAAYLMITKVMFDIEKYKNHVSVAYNIGREDINIKVMQEPIKA